MERGNITVNLEEHLKNQTGHFKNGDFELKLVLLDGTAISPISEITGKYRLTAKILADISDNAANKNAVVNEQKQKGFDCFAQNLDMIIKNELEIVNLLPDKIKKVVVFFIETQV